LFWKITDYFFVSTIKYNENGNKQGKIIFFLNMNKMYENAGNQMAENNEDKEHTSVQHHA